MRLGILCNGIISLPAIQQLVQLGQQLAIFLPSTNLPWHQDIKSYAQYFGIPVHYISKKQITEELIHYQTTYSFDFLFVITFPYILPKNLLSDIGIPILNFHYAPLPKYRGAEPVFWMIKNGEKEGGLTIHEMTEEVDGGGIILYKSMQIEGDTFGLYTSKAGELARQCMADLIKAISDTDWKNKLKLQNKGESKYWGKPGFNDILIDWEKMTAAEIKQLCCACNPWNNGAQTTLDGKSLKIVEVEILETINRSETFGEIVSHKNTNKLGVNTHNGLLVCPLIVYTENGLYSSRTLEKIGFIEGKVLV